MKEVGGSGKQYFTPPVEYMPPLQSFGFVSKTLKCEKCQSEFETALSVSAHIRSAHHEELRKMFAKEEYFPASFFCLRASSSWKDDIFDTDLFLRHKIIHLLRSLSLLPHWNLLIFLTCKSKYNNQWT